MVALAGWNKPSADGRGLHTGLALCLHSAQPMLVREVALPLKTVGQSAPNPQFIGKPSISWQTQANSQLGVCLLCQWVCRGTMDSSKSTGAVAGWLMLLRCRRAGKRTPVVAVLRSMLGGEQRQASCLAPS